jgi:hypothetical protein
VARIKGGGTNIGVGGALTLLFFPFLSFLKLPFEKYTSYLYTFIYLKSQEEKNE